MGIKVKRRTGTIRVQEHCQKPTPFEIN